jgi:hypothetical protein
LLHFFVIYFFYSNVLLTTMTHKNLFFLSTSNVLYLLHNQNSKMLVYKRTTEHIAKNRTTASKIANQIKIKKNHQSVYSTLKYSYVSFLRIIWKNIKTTFHIFSFIIQKNDMFYNINYSLKTWATPLNIMFRLAWVKKHNKPTMWIRYINCQKRFFIVWRWLAILYKFFLVIHKNFLGSFLALWEEFFCKPISLSKIAFLKVKVYKIYLFKLY